MLLTGYFGGYSTEHARTSTEPELAAARMIGAAATERHKPVVVQTIFPDSPSARVLRATPAIPVHRDVDRACDVLAGAGRRARRPTRRAVPSPAAPPSPTRRTTRRGRCSPTRASPFAPARVVHHVGRAPEALAEPELAFPVVLKAIGGCTSPTAAASSSDCRTPPRPGGVRSTWSRASRRRPSRSRRWPTSTPASS